ncbi:hypothetical protein HPS36_08895 [Halorubrum salinarum]|uniref:DUF4352 domain-containing protein n=1 Tax=Halorubrum salinarum TaxID=2739057 RepID=A0A7D3XUK1_9EURY|nr:hypothetical protein [Halorubrum salinarum]QKG92969.1 hypothetical protein HPS36_08895 [Halorubrum salinarum]
MTKVRMAGGHVPPPSDLTVYRCYRCFAKFTDEEAAGPDEGGDETDGDRGIDEAARNPQATDPVRVVDVDLAVSPAGGKRAVDRFALTLRNDGAEPVRVARAELSFPDGEESVAPVDPVLLAPDETATVAVARDWLYPEQDAVTVRFLGDGDAVGSVRVTDLD